MMLNMPNEKKKDNLIERPPVVAVLGHVDHGKSSLLEAIREDFVITKKESGGITQHIGAYQIEHEGKKITFIDTPGHEAFSAMRQRGANAADIALLVIDAAEGIKEQTKEAIKFIKKAGVPMIVVFNKMDKPGAMPEKVKKQLSDVEVLVESYGGKIPSAEVSAKEKTGIKELLETILLVAEVEELKADFDASASGVVVESSLHPQKGAVATLIVEQGILRNNDIVAGFTALGKVRGLRDFRGKLIEQALPSCPVSVLGFNSPPGAGEKFEVYATKEQAEKAVFKERAERRTSPLVAVEQGMKVLNIVLKCDVLGSVEAVNGILKSLPQEKVVLRILKSEVGDINVKDVQLTESGGGQIFGFRVKTEEQAKQFAKQKTVKIKLFDVIYELVQEVRKAMTGALSPEVKRTELAKFKITHLFKQTKQVQIVGGKVLDGEITQNSRAEVFREEEIIGKGRIKGLQQEKKEVGKVSKGKEAGIQFEGDVILQENDILRVFKEEKQKGSL